MRPGAEHERRAGVDHGVREGARVAAILAEEVLGSDRRVQLTGALRAGVHDHDHQRGLAVRASHERLSGAHVEQVGVIGIGGEAEHRHTPAGDATDRNLTRQPVVAQARARERGDRLGSAARPVVERVVVGEVQDAEAQRAQLRGIRGRRLKGEAVSPVDPPALRAAADRQRALEVAERQVRAQQRPA